MASKKKVIEPKKVKSSDIDPKKRVSEAPDVLYDPADPKHQWERPLQAPGRMQVDFEERIDFRRLHEYRLARTRNALKASGLGALLCFDQVAIGIGGEGERTLGEQGKLAVVPIREIDAHAAWHDLVRSIERVGREARLSLLAIGDHGRSGGQDQG